MTFFNDNPDYEAFMTVLTQAVERSRTRYVHERRQDDVTARKAPAMSIDD